MEARQMKLLFENWRKYMNEVDTDNDGSLDPEEIRKMAADLEGGGASENDRDAVRQLLQYDYGVPAEQVMSMVDKLEQLGGEAWTLAAEEGQITDEAQQAMGLEIETPAPQYGAHDPRTARKRVATSGWHGSLVAPKEFDPQGRGWDRD
jgi:hypothetical protein